MLEFPYLQTVISAVLAFALGVLWYHPKVMGTRWREARGKDGVDQPFTKWPVLISLLLWLLSACFFSFLIGILDVSSFGGMISLACLLWVAFSMPPTLMGSLYTGYSFQAVAIDSAYQLAGYYLFAVVHFAMFFLSDYFDAPTALVLSQMSY